MTVMGAVCSELGSPPQLVMELMENGMCTMGLGGLDGGRGWGGVTNKEGKEGARKIQNVPTLVIPLPFR